MKIGIAGIHIESCTFSPLRSGAQDFRVLRGGDILANFPFVSGAPDVTPVPLLYARALPGGPVEAGFYQDFRAELLRLLEQNGPFDGLYLPMHGALAVVGLEDAEGDLLAAVRQVVGKDCLLAASYDLHGNLTGRIMASLDLLSAYRTAPHVDWLETQQRVFGFLARCLREGLRPVQAYARVPVLFAGEKSSTEWEPAAGLYRRIPQVIEDDAVMDASVLIGYIWADEPRSAASVSAFGLDRARVAAAVEILAREMWQARERFQFGVEAGSVDECIRLALAPQARPVILSDSGDNPTAGGAGDTPFVLERLLACNVRNALFASIPDLAALQRCEAAGVGAQVELELGGKLDPVHARPLRVSARVRSLHNLPWTLARGQGVLNRLAVIEVQGVTVIITERRTPFHRQSDFSDLGLDPRGFDLIVVKIGYLEPELRQLAARALLALSPGAVNQDVLRLPYHRLERPVYPFDTDFDWEPRIQIA